MYLKYFFLVIMFFCFTEGIYGQINTTSNRYLGCAPDSFKFYTVGNTHSGQIWNSGNGNTSILDSPIFTYSIPGTYTVTIGALSRTITIYPKLNFNFTTDSSFSGCFPFRFNLKDITVYPAGINASEVKWIYQNGGSKIGSHIQDVIPTYYFHYCYVTMQVKTTVPSCFGELRKDSFFKILDVPRAKISLTPKTACKVPFTPTINNLSKDSLGTTLSYLWSWDHPTAGTSTNTIPPPLTFNTNTLATFILEAKNQYGCSSKDTVRLVIDTPKLEFTASNRLCRSPYRGLFVIKNFDATNFTYEFRSQTRSAGSAIFSLASTSISDSNYFTGFHADFPNKDTSAYFYITKRSKADTSCSTTESKLVRICQTFPIPEIRFNNTCGTPFVDTIIARNWSPCWDYIDFKLAYTDKYTFRITRDSFRARKPDSIRKNGPDTILLYGLNKLLKTDEFYRRGPLILGVNINFINAETGCSHTYSPAYSQTKTSLFRPHLVNYYSNGCRNRKDSFYVFHYGIGTIDSVIWHLGDGSIKRTKLPWLDHTFLNPGIYKTFAIVKNTSGCIDTVNSVFTYRSDSILPVFSLSKKNFCISDSTAVTIANASSFQRWNIITDRDKSFNCSQSSSFNQKFYHTGKHYLRVKAENMGCVTEAIDSLQISGPKFNLDYDFNCSRRDSILFFVTDTADIHTFINWDFGDGVAYDTLGDTIWHKFTGSNNDYLVKLHSQNSNGCQYSDSTMIRIRNVKAVFSDTLFCKKTNPDVLLNGLPYTFNALSSQNADYTSHYRYTFQLETIAKPGKPAKKHSPFTGDGLFYVNIPEDTMNLTLTARDINGCEDKMTKRIIVTDNYINFTITYADSCPPATTLQMQNLSYSPWGLQATLWSLFKVKNGIPQQIATSASLHSLFNVSTLEADTFIIRLEIIDKANCKLKSLDKQFVFDIDTSRLIVPDTVCQELSNNIRSSENDISKFKYRWYINNVLITDDTSFQLNYKFTNLGKQRIRLEKTKRQTGCTKTFVDSTVVYPRPRLHIENTFDSILNKCFPASTTISYFDSASIPSLSFKFVHKGIPRTLNPTTIGLDRGANLTEAVFWTSYGCNLVIPILDTVYGPNADLFLDKKAICKNDSITFTLINAQDVDSVLWSFGDGTIRSGIDKIVTHRYTSANAFSDSIPISFIVYAPNKSCPLAKVDTIFVYEAISKHHLNNKLDTAICQRPISIHNTAPRADYFKWTMSNGDISSSDLDSFVYDFKTSGNFKIIQYAYRNPLGCVDSSISNIILYPKPKLTASIDTICLGKKIEINYTVDLPNTKILLSPDSFKGSPFISSPIQTSILKNTLFKLTGVSEFGCRDSILTNAVVVLPRIEKSWDTIVASGKKIILPVGYDPNWLYTWTPKWKDPSCENCANPEMQIFDSVVYNLTIEDRRECFKSSYKFAIRVFPDILVKVPTAFTPNGDGNNDILFAKGFGIKKLLSFKIFNRQGQILFLSNDENHGWDGNYKDVPQNSEVYYYIYEAESFIPGKIVSGEGNFMLLR
ncbi:MAG: T9SS type B sorting domain-containing protein [Chitinophagales bacterium]|nr:gliding motility-associated C-terminal domain-containing protein [Sphingobacteriales bacterium]